MGIKRGRKKNKQKCNFWFYVKYLDQQEVYCVGAYEWLINFFPAKKSVGANVTGTYGVGATLLLLATTCYHLYICLTIFKSIEIYLKKVL